MEGVLTMEQVDKRCTERAGHFAGDSFGAGIALVLFIAWFIFMIYYDPVNTSVRKEAVLPSTCRPGEKIVMTTAPKAEYNECEAHWVRK